MIPMAMARLRSLPEAAQGRLRPLVHPECGRSPQRLLSANASVSDRPVPDGRRRPPELPEATAQLSSVQRQDVEEKRPAERAVGRFPICAQSVQLALRREADAASPRTPIRLHCQSDLQWNSRSNRPGRLPTKMADTPHRVRYRRRRSVHCSPYARSLSASASRRR